MKHGLIVGGGPVDPTQLQVELQAEPGLVIAADRGGEHLVKASRYPDVLVGDCDSLTRATLEKIQGAGAEIHRFPAAKDQTDLELALDLALERGCPALRILGGLGERLDHTLGNIGLLSKALKQGVRAYLLDPDHEVTLMEGAMELPAKPGWGVSLIPFTPVIEGVTTSGLAFPLTNENLTIDHTRGLHNEWRAAQASVTVRGGILIVICFRED